MRKFTPEWHFAADYLLPDAGMILDILRLETDQDAAAMLETFTVRSFRGQYNTLDPGNVYRVGSSGCPVFAPEWHAGEETHRWTAARAARMTIVVNPGEAGLLIQASSSYPGPYWAEVLLDGESLHRLRWSEPGPASAKLELPANARGKCAVTFRVPHLWQPSNCMGSDDPRLLGVSIQELRVF
jgi:hypothetical protein